MHTPPHPESAPGPSSLLGALLVICSLFVTGAAAQKSAKPPSQNSPAQLFELGFFYYNNNDITDDKAAKQFKLVIAKYPTSAEAERAQFFLGSYYHRKFNIKASRGQGVLDDLYSSKEAYEAYLRKYPRGGPCKCLADAHFNLALVYLQLGLKQRANILLSNARNVQAIDDKIYVQQIIWSDNSKDIIDSHFDTTRLSAFAYQIIALPFDSFVNQLKAWCRSEKSRDPR